MKHGKLSMTAGLLLTVCAAAADDRLLLERLRTNHAAMVAAGQDFHERRQRGNLNGVEAADYATYVARLHRRVAEDCVAVLEAGLPVPPDLDCPALPRMPAPAAIDQAAEQTADEQIAGLDAELTAGLGEFDEMLLREQERVRAATPMTDAGGGGGGAEGAGAASGEGAAEDEADGSPGSDGDGRTSEGVGAGPGAQRQAGRPGTPPDIPDGSDDDVVARQLREAAEKETDPELKKKLWEEYRKYKQGTR
jgi:hypothetical protein